MNHSNKIGETNPALICGRFPAYVESVKASHEYKQVEALKAAREYMAVRCGGDDWTNRVRQMLNDALGIKAQEYNHAFECRHCGDPVYTAGSLCFECGE
jgi:hypothetical protein